MAKETLARLYKLQPSAKKAISRSAGYGVFSNFGMKIFFAGSGKGKGIVIHEKLLKLSDGITPECANEDPGISHNHDRE